MVASRGRNRESSGAGKVLKATTHARVVDSGVQRWDVVVQMSGMIGRAQRAALMSCKPGGTCRAR